MKARIVLLYILLSLAFLPGCSLIVREVVVKGKSIAGMRNLPRIDPNDPNCIISSIKIVKTQDGRKFNVEIKESGFAINMRESPCRVKYEDDPGPLPGIIIEGELAGRSQRYPIRIDTGQAHFIVVSDIHILENNLAIYLAGTHDGICCLPDLHIGKLTLSNLVANFYFQHSEIQLFGLPIKKDKEILVGVPLLQRFKYVAFDSINEEVEFSTEQSFLPQDRTLWSRYPFSKLSDFEGNPRVFVEIPIAGQNMNLIFDTGCQGALFTTEKIWQQTQKRLHKVKKSIKSVFAPFMGGNIRSRTVIVKELNIGDRIVNNAFVGIVPNDNSIFESMKNQEGLLGLQCFADRTVILDFEREVMWGKNNRTP
jgi:hypothetical protein